MYRSALAIGQSLNKNVIALSAVLVFGSVSAPAIANSASASDNFRITNDELKDNETPLGKSDPAFRALHNDWGSAVGSSVNVEVSVPSINPVEAMRLSSGFGYRRAPTRGASRNHKGIDIPGPVGTPIFATADGIVGRAKWLRGYGKFIELEHGNDISTRYAHMSALNVRFGQRVRKGDVIGYMGSTGRSTGSHLHYEVRISGIAVNPMAFLPPKQTSIAKNDRNVAKELQADNQVDTSAAGGPEE